MFAASKTDQNVAGGPPPSGDPYWTSVSLLTNFENNLTFQDGSTNNFAITRTGVVNPSLNSPFGAVGGSEFFNGSTGYLSTPTNAAFDFGTGDLTMEAWIYITGAPAAYLGTYGGIVVSKNTDNVNLGFYLFLTATSTAGFTGVGFTQYYSVPNAESISRSFTFAQNTWYHLAVSKQSGSVKLFINGTQQGATATFTQSQLVSTAQVTTGGQSFSGGYNYYFPGNISNLRIVKGTAVYTANFTPPTAPLTAITNTSLLITGTGQGMFNNATFVDQGPNALTVTATGAPVYSGRSPFGNTYAGSVLFNGSSYLTTASSGTAAGDFTYEAWVYPTTSTTGIVLTTGSETTGRTYMYVTSAQQLGWGVYLVGDYTLGGTVTLNQWSHIAIVRSGTTVKGYVNGTVLGTTTTYSGTAGNANGFAVGSNKVGSPNFAGYISNARVVNGTAVYTANFTPSTTPLTAITNTSLLVRGDTGAFYDLSNNGLAETGIGAPVVTTQVKKFGSESGSFPGSSNLSIPNSTPLQLNNSTAFTLECWIYPTTISTGRWLFTNLNQSSPYQGYAFGIGCDNFNTQLQFWDGGSWRYFGAITANVWTHIAITYQGSGTTGLVFVNGVQQGSAFTVNSNINYTVGTAFIGSSTSTTGFFAGYLDDIRITKGVARYTANFTPPTATFPTGP
jgi:hypothetical protein